MINTEYDFLLYLEIYLSISLYFESLSCVHDISRSTFASFFFMYEIYMFF